VLAEGSTRGLCILEGTWRSKQKSCAGAVFIGGCSSSVLLGGKTGLDARLKVSVAKIVMSPNVLVHGTAETAPRKVRKVSSVEALCPPSNALRKFEGAMDVYLWI